MKKLICCIFVFVVTVKMTWAQQEPLIPKPDFGVNANEGQSELIITNIAYRLTILVTINGARAAHLWPGEIAKIVVNNGIVTVEAQVYDYNKHRGWYPDGAASSLVINADSQSIRIQVNKDRKERAYVILSTTTSLGTQNQQ